MNINLSPEVLWGYITQAARSSVKFCLVIIPLVAVYEVLKGMKFFGRQGKRLEPWAARLHFSPQSIFPLTAGIFLGLLYGAGILINAARERSLTHREILILSLFLAACHAIIEDTMLFVVIGANGWWIIGPRVLIAALVTFAAGYLWPKQT